MPVKSLSIPILILLPLLLVLFTGCKDGIITSGWNEKQITIDGEFGDWDSFARSTDSDRKISISVANDDSFLFVQVRHEIDSPYARRGINFWIDPVAREEKSFCVRYMDSTHASFGRQQLSKRRGNKSDRYVPESMGSRFNGRTPPGQIGLQFDEEGSIVLVQNDGSDGLQVKSSQFNQVMVYEFAIPLKTSEGFRYAPELKSETDFAIGFEWTPAKMAGMRGRGGGAKSGMGGRGGMSGGQQGGMDRGGMGPGGIKGMNSKKTTINWVKVSLADKGE